MSQHVIEEGDIRWVFGWDQPLQTFFLQKHDVNLDPDDNPIIWLGASKATLIYEVDELVTRAAKHGLDIPYAMQVVLFGDKDDGR